MGRKGGTRDEEGEGYKGRQKAELESQEPEGLLRLFQYFYPYLFIEAGWQESRVSNDKLTIYRSNRHFFITIFWS